VNKTNKVSVKNYDDLLGFRVRERNRTFGLITNNKGKKAIWDAIENPGEVFYFDGLSGMMWKVTRDRDELIMSLDNDTSFTMEVNEAKMKIGRQ